MNSLSLWLYLADVFGSVDNAAFNFGILFGVLTAISTVALLCSLEDKNEPAVKVFNRFVKWSGSLLTACVILVIFIPSQKTMYMILASEVGEEVVISEEMDLVREAIQKKLNEYVNEED